MLWLLVAPVVLFFVAMGIIGLFQPEQIGGIFGIDIVGADARSEIRAVYGGFGVGLAILVVVAARSEGGAWGLGALAAAMAAMAAGRLLSLMLDRVDAAYPGWAFFGVEVVLAALLGGAATVHG